MNSYSIDAILYYKLKTAKKKEHLESKWSVTFENIEVIYTQKLFKFIWKKPNWMKKIFQLLFDDYGREGKEIPENLDELRKQIQNEILVIEKINVSDEFEVKWMTVLQIFQKYFIENSKIEELQDITSIYKILCKFQELNALSM